MALRQLSTGECFFAHQYFFVVCINISFLLFSHSGADSEINSTAAATFDENLERLLPIFLFSIFKN